jgi:hypothetical protein
MEKNYAGSGSGDKDAEDAKFSQKSQKEPDQFEMVFSATSASFLRVLRPAVRIKAATPAQD